VSKTFLEDYLGLNKREENRPVMSVNTTEGQAEYLQILNNTEQYLKRQLRFGSVMSFTRLILWVFCLVNLIGVAVSVWLYLIGIRGIRLWL
jgi:hypothetical protein